MRRFAVLLHRAIWRAFEHDAFVIAKAAAYSSILTLFPAFLVLASVLALSHKTSSAAIQIEMAIGRIMPPGTSKIALDYFAGNDSRRPTNVIISASIVMILAASGVLISWMEGFRRAYLISQNPWGFWKERGMALLLIPLSLIPLAFATFLVAFGSQIENWMSLHTFMELRPVLLFAWGLTRWVIATLTSIAVIALIYHMAVMRTQPWYKVLPGAYLVTALWFPATLAFGWYVTKYANYALIYGSLGAAIALLVWLYMMSIIILIGAEFNAVVFPKTLSKVPQSGVSAASG